MNSEIVETIKSNPKYIDDIQNIDDEMLLYAIHFGYKYSDDTYDKFCEKDFYVRTNIKKIRFY